MCGWSMYYSRCFPQIRQPNKKMLISNQLSKKKERKKKHEKLNSCAKEHLMVLIFKWKDRDLTGVYVKGRRGSIFLPK